MVDGKIPPRRYGLTPAGAERMQEVKSQIEASHTDVDIQIIPPGKYRQILNLWDSYVTGYFLMRLPAWALSYVGAWKIGWNWWGLLILAGGIGLGIMRTAEVVVTNERVKKAAQKLVEQEPEK